MRHLGIDYGTKRIGIAVSDEMGSLAFPLTTVLAGPKALSEIGAIVKKEKIEKIVLGESRDYKGAPNPVMEDIAEFKKDLEKLAGVPVVYEAEFLTSAMAQRSGGDDSSAAALILQSYLDRMKNNGGKN